MIHTPAQAAPDREFLVFPNINAIHRDEKIDLADQEMLSRDRTEPAVDFFYSRDFGRLRLIAEFLVNGGKNHGSEFERLQLGRQIRESTRIWGGRFHTPVGYWNTQYHHGNYLETAISRPSAISYEDDGGIIPMHAVGIELEGAFKHGKNTLGYDLAMGLGPELKKHGLETLDIVDPEGSHDPVFSVRLRFNPNEDGPDQYGVFVSRSSIPSDRLGDVDQTVAGAYGNWEDSRLHLTGALFTVHNAFRRARSSQFANAYLQAETPLALRWTLFARLEDGWGDNDDTYLKGVAAYVYRRQLGGLRLELGATQAIKVEVSNSHYLGNHSEQVMLQWSAVIP